MKTVKYLTFLALGILLLYFAFNKVDFKEVMSILVQAKYSWVLLSLLFSVFALISRSRRWILLIEPLGHKPRLWNTYNAVLFGYLANYALPRMGEVTKCIALNRKEKIPVDSLIGTVVVERAIDFFSLIVIFVFLLIARFEKFGTFFTTYVFHPISLKVSNAFGAVTIFWLIIVFGMVLILSLIIIFRKRIFQHKLVQRIIKILKGVVDGLKTVRKMQHKWEFLFHTLFIWLNYALMTWVIVFSLPEITGDLKFADGIFLLVIGSLGMVVPVQSGIGAFHWIVSRGLHFVYGLNLTDGLVFATLQHESQTLFILIAGSISMIFLFQKRKSRTSSLKKDKIESI